MPMRVVTRDELEPRSRRSCDEVRDPRAGILGPRSVAWQLGGDLARVPRRWSRRAAPARTSDGRVRDRSALAHARRRRRAVPAHVPPRVRDGVRRARRRALRRAPRARDPRAHPRRRSPTRSARGPRARATTRTTPTRCAGCTRRWSTRRSPCASASTGRCRPRVKDRYIVEMNRFARAVRRSRRDAAAQLAPSTRATWRDMLALGSSSRSRRARARWRSFLLGRGGPAAQPPLGRLAEALDRRAAAAAPRARVRPRGAAGCRPRACGRLRRARAGVPRAAAPRWSRNRRRVSRRPTRAARGRSRRAGSRAWTERRAVRHCRAPTVTGVDLADSSRGRARSA